ncbi:DUF927 domain-containing protein [Acidibrevibacterium fodinaquatile]|uniref:DUF927 domain-containing protein n=1 Tax=Acidibrevibacterium fodinaquatile TaxID=1969806 RepID=UPI000E0DFF61|nr:DUF927 domain-containing protein [Acidibrevibacterium fodinaquatile]
MAATIDLAEARSARRAQSALQAAVAAAEATTGERYRLTGDGLLRLRPGGFPELVCGRIDVLGNAYDPEARASGMLVRFLDRNREEVRLVVPHRLFRRSPFDLARLLARRGFTVRPSRAAARAVKAYLAAFGEPESDPSGRAC